MCQHDNVTFTSYTALRERLLVADPDVVAAADEVDRDLIDSFGALPIRGRLNRAGRMAAQLESLRDGRRRPQS